MSPNVWLGWLIIIGTIVVLAVCTMFLARYGVDRTSRNSSPFWLFGGGGMFGHSRDTTVAAYERLTMEQHRDNERRLEDLRSRTPTTQATTEAPVIETTEGTDQWRP